MNPEPIPRSSPARRERDVIASAAAELVVLLFVPAMALGRLAAWVDWRVLAGAPTVFSVVIYFLYRMDKLRAGVGEWRVPEVILHLGEFVGGWPGGLLAQRIFRHKTAKISYQMIFWLIILLHQCVALDFLLGWKLSRTVGHFVSNPV